MDQKDPTILEYLKARLSWERLKEFDPSVWLEGLPGKAMNLEENPAAQGEHYTSSRIPAEYWFFLAGLLLYLFTRFVALSRFPIYFFSDEAIQTIAAKDLLRNGFRDPLGNLFPLFFNNGGQYNLSASVYLQTLIAGFPNTVWLTRGLPALVTLVFPLFMGLALRDFFKIKTWWLAPFVVSAIPAWFLHSRTAFETCLGSAFFALFLYFYLRYRLLDRKAVVWVVLFAAVAFYSYAPLQLVVVLTALVLFFSDLRYHFNRQSALPGFLALLIVALPYLLFRLQFTDSLQTHLYKLSSYWLEQIPLSMKFFTFFKNYLFGFDPTYWFIPNKVDLIRHQMKGYGHLPLWSLPLIITALVQSVRQFKQPEHRTLLIALLSAPAGAALVDPSITRLMVFIVPAAYLTCLGLDALLGWLLKNVTLTPRRSSLILLPLLFASLWMTQDALRNGPTWFDDYSMYGMQWGGQTLFNKIKTWQKQHPGQQIVLSPSWANATDVLARYFLEDSPGIRLDTYKAWSLYYTPPLDSNILFIMLPEELKEMSADPKFTDWAVLDQISWPDGRPGFYFVTLRYADNAQAIFEQQALERRIPKTAIVQLMGQDVMVDYSPLDLGEIWQAFDGDDRSVIRSFEANPLRIKLTFKEAVTLNSVNVLVGGPPTDMALEVLSASGETTSYTQALGSSSVVRPISVTFENPIEVKEFTLSVSNTGESEPAHVHIWEIKLR